MRKTAFTRIVSVFLSLCLMLGLITTGAPLGVMPTLHAAESHNITSSPLDIFDSGDYIVTGSTITNYIYVYATSGTVNITLENVTITATTTPLIIESGATVNLTLLGNNTLQSHNYAGIYVPSGATLNITPQSTGTLTVIANDAPAIGDDMGSQSGTITIGGGSVYAKRFGGGTPVIGSSVGGSGNITITGGSVSANDGVGSPGLITPAPTNGSNQVYQTLVTLSGVSTATPVTYSVDSGASINAVTDNEGRLYLWLPEGERTLAVTANGKIYTANVTVAPHNNNYVPATAPPTVSPAHISLSGSTGTGGAFKLGDTVTATWNNSASGDNNPNIDSVTMDFTAFGGGPSVTANPSSDTWTATYTLTAGSINNASDCNVSVTATDDQGKTTTATGANVKVDNQAPTVTDGAISITGATGNGGAFKVGNTVTATWDNTAGGDNNSDIAAVTVDFSQFGGGTAVNATNSDGTWTAQYTIASGSINNVSNRNISVTATDNCGNTTTTADTTNATVDNQLPIVTTDNVAVSGATGPGGLFITGDTITVTWNNTAGGDGNTDIAVVTADFSAFGGGAAVSATNDSDTWMATYTLAAGSINATNRSVLLTVTDTVGNRTTYTKTPGSDVNNTIMVVTNGNITITEAGDYTVMGTTTTNTITVNPNISGDVNLTLDGVSIDVSSIDNKTALSVGAGSTLNLTLTGDNTLKSGVGRAGVQVPSGATLVIMEESDGSLNATGGNNGAGIGGTIGSTTGAITVNAGTLTATGGNMAAGIGGGYNGAGGSITINGGTVTAVGVNMAAGIGGGYNGGAGTILINDGIVNATSGGYAAGIGGGSGGTSGSITITGGTVTASDPSYNGAGIGGGYQSAGIAISITGGNITATGAGNGAGIGGGQNGTVASIAISGDTTIVNATGGTCAAGIGGGSEGASGIVTISGGTITANGGGDAPGIGNGAYCASDSGSVTITGGTVTATGGNSAAGIGGGSSGNGSSVTISGGNVTANGGQNSAGIGGGSNALSGIVTISGGTVTATGGADGAGIGGGYYGTGGTIVISGGTVTATRGSSLAKDLGAGFIGSFGSITITGGSVKATNGTASPTPTNGTSPVYCVAVTTSDLSSQQTVEYKVDAAAYASITTHPDGKLYLWQTGILHQFTVHYNDTVYSSAFIPAANNDNQLTLKLARTLTLGDYTTTYTGSPIPYDGTVSATPALGGSENPMYYYFTSASDRAAMINGVASAPANAGTYYVLGFVAETATHGAVYTYATMTIEKATQPAPTSPVVNDTENTFNFTIVSGTFQYNYEYSINGGSNWTDVTANPISVGNVAIPAGDLQVRLKGNDNYLPGAVLTNPSAFTATLEGSVAITGTPKFGHTLTATVTGAQSNAVFAYEWKRGSTVIPGATASTYTLTLDDIGNTITVAITAPPYTGSVTDTTAAVTKADAPAAPSTLSATAQTDTSVTLNQIPGAQYRVGSGEWQDSHEFASLTPATQYSFSARIKETDTQLASEITTITVYTRPSVPAAGAVTVSYTNETVTYNSSTLELNTASDFTGTAIANSGAITSYVGTDLYLRVKASGSVPASEAVTVTLPARPAAPSIGRVSRTLAPGFGITATVEPDSGSPKYLVNGGAWRDSPEFTNLSFNTPYSFQVVYPATESAFHSALSAPVTVTWTSADFNAGEIAALITAITAPAANATTLTLPTVPAGYTVGIKSVSPDTTTLSTSGTITPPATAKTVTVVLTVTRTSDSTEADTAELTVTIPAKKTSTGGSTGGSSGETGSTGTGSGYVQDDDIYTGSGHTSITLSGDATTLTAQQVNSLITQNASSPVIIRGAGYTVTFPTGSMRQSLGGRSVNLALVFNWASDHYNTIKPLAGSGYVMLLDFLHSGALPGTANIRVNVGTAFAGKTLYYYYYNPDYKAFEYRQAGVVDAAGFITLSQSSCSQYVLSTTALSNERPGIPETGGGAQAPTRSAPLLFTLPQSKHEEEQMDGDEE